LCHMLLLSRYTLFPYTTLFRSLYIFCSWHKVDIFKQELEKYFKIKNILIWEKNNTGMGDLYGDYAPKYEMCIFINNGKDLNNGRDRKSTRLNSSHVKISYAVFC